MPGITPYQQGQFASGVVGTPNEGLQRTAELSGAKMFEGIGSSLVDQGAAQKKAADTEALTQQKQMATLARETQATTIATNAEADSRKDMNNMQMQFRQNPIAGMDAYNQQSQGRSSATVQQVAQQNPNDPELPLLVQKKLQENLAARMNTLGSWADSLQVPNAQRNLAEGAGALSVHLGEMGGSPIAEAMAQVDKYKNDPSNIQAYQTFSPKGTAALHDAGSAAMKEYVMGVALRGKPQDVEDAVNTLKDKDYMTNSELVSVRSQALAQAAHQATINAQTVAGQQQAALLDTTKELVNPIGGGNGNPANNNPGYNSMVLAKNAKNLNPNHLISLMDMTGKGQASVESAEAQGNFKAYIAANAPEGDISKANPAVIKAGLAQFGKNMTPEQKAEAQVTLAKSQGKQTTVEQETNINAQIGIQTKGLNSLTDMIHASLARVGATTNDPVMNAKARQDTETLLNRYHTSYIALHAMRENITDPGVRRLMAVEDAAQAKSFDHFSAALRTQGDPVRAQAVQAHKTLYDNLYQKLAPGFIYSDPKMQASYEYYHNKIFYDTIDKYNLTDAQLTQINNSGYSRDPKHPTQLDKMRHDIHSKTTDLLHSLKLIPQ